MLNGNGMDLYLRDIAQAYTQPTTLLSRDFFVRPPPELGFEEYQLLKVMKPLYGIPEAGNHWFNTVSWAAWENYIVSLSMFGNRPDGQQNSGSGERPRFAQIYTVDSTLRQADDRLHYNPHLDRAVLEHLYASLRRTNPYIAGLKTCEQRIRGS